MPNFISIPNIIGNFYGGQPYNVDLQVNFDGPSTLKISVFNETGEYGTPNPNYSSIQTIVIGNFSFVGYLVKYRTTEQADSKILELEYKDCSVKLDQIFIGLHKRHGLNPEAGTVGVNNEYFLDIISSNSSIIIMGREILKSKADLGYGGYSSSHIHDVGYSFNELLSKLNISNVSIPNINYVKDYSGNLREVLSSWCSDYGLMYYWEFGASTLQSGLKFFDLKNVIRIAQDVTNNCEITNKTLEVSAEGTVAIGEIAYYDREGGPINYSIPPQLLTLRCLTLGDLYNDNSSSSLLKYIQLGVSLSYYSQSLRDLLYWFNYRKINGPNRLMELSNDELVIFGLSDVRNVYSSDINSSQFVTIKAFGADGDTIGNKADNLSAIHGLEYYFFVAKFNEEAAKAQIAFEDGLANEFLGKHWIRSYDVGGRKPQLNVEGPGIDVKYIDSLAGAPALPFANFGHQNGTYVGNLVQEGQGGTYDLKRSIIYGERTGMWYPNKGDQSAYQNTVDYYDSMCFKYIDSAYDNLLQDIGLDGDLYNQGKGYGIWVAFIRDSLPITKTPVNNFLDENQMSPVYAGDENNTIIGYYGLKSNQCYWITFDGFRFMAPCGAIADDDGGIPSRGGSYVVKVGDSREFSFLSPKIQYTNCNVPQLTGVAKANIQFNVISGDDISQVKPFVAANSAAEAGVNRTSEISDVKNYVNNVLNETSFVQKENSNYLQFTLAGLPNKNISIRDGLDSLSISVNDNGIFTQYAYSDKLIKAQETQNVRKLKNILINYNHLPKRYMSLLESTNSQSEFIPEIP